MEDILIEMLEEARKHLDIHPKVLCRGICTEEMYYMVLDEKRTIDRVTIKRLLSRLGVDNGNYEHFLENGDYEIWRGRMNIINAIEKNLIEEAKKLLKEYGEYDKDDRNVNRANVDKQFCIFMELQIMRHIDKQDYESKAKYMYGEALRQTVTYIEEMPMNAYLLSPLEFNLYFEYERRKADCSKDNELLDLYKKFFKYIDNAPYGKLSVVKIYPKAVVCLYEDVKQMRDKYGEKSIGNIEGLYERLLKYCEKALNMLMDKKTLLYIIELMYMRIELCNELKRHKCDVSNVEKYKEIIADTEPLLRNLFELYEEYEESPYMLDDCYLYRESGMYCVPDVIKTRRGMLHMTQEELCKGICSVKTLAREENKYVAMQRRTFKEIFKRLGLYPNYINMGIVTNKKEAVELYEELRYAGTSFKFDDVRKIIPKLRKLLIEIPHPINDQILERLESHNMYRMGKKNAEEHIETLLKALQYTIKLSDITEYEDAIFLPTEELETLYLISATYKEEGKFDKAYEYIEAIWKYCKQLEVERLEDGRMGVYELIMGYMSSLLGDMGRFDEANEMADKLIKLALRLRKNMEIHQSLYNKAWNYKECKKRDFDYNHELYRCIYLSRLTRDESDELFYTQQFI